MTAREPSPASPEPSDEQINQFARHAADRIPASNYEGRVLRAVRMALRAQSTPVQPSTEGASRAAEPVAFLWRKGPDRFLSVCEVSPPPINAFAVYATPPPLAKEAEPDAIYQAGYDEGFMNGRAALGQ
jgi:hypothetical protein